jgi:hypothetical protein
MEQLWMAPLTSFRSEAAPRKPIYIGIDPGWINLGLSIVTPSNKIGKVEVLATKVFDPSKGPLAFSTALPLIINGLVKDTTLYELKGISIERYVPYSNTMTQETENITMLIGMITSTFFIDNPCGKGAYPELVRAIDWKVKMARGNARVLGFDNPADKLDKKYSLAMAKFLTENKYEFQTDHEADATCIASIPILAGQNIYK